MRLEAVGRRLPHTDGLNALRFFLSRRPDQSPSTDTLICLTELILTLNNFSFNSSHFLHGVAMGTHMGPSYACLFIGYMGKSLFRSHSGTTLHLYLPYFDD
eukprot:g22130.t1